MSVIRITKFHNYLRDVVTILSDRFPEDKEVEYTKSQIELAVSVSPRGTITTFMGSARPYLEKILHKDEQFFLCMADGTKSLKGLAINDKWGKLTDEDKDRLWKTVQKMVVLGNKILTEE